MYRDLIKLKTHWALKLICTKSNLTKLPSDRRVRVPSYKSPQWLSDKAYKKQIAVINKHKPHLAVNIKCTESHQTHKANKIHISVLNKLKPHDSVLNLKCAESQQVTYRIKLIKDRSFNKLKPHDWILYLKCAESHQVTSHKADKRRIAVLINSNPLIGF